MNIFLSFPNVVMFFFCYETVKCSSIKKCSQAVKFNINTVWGKRLFYHLPYKSDGAIEFGSSHSHCHCGRIYIHPFHRTSSQRSNIRFHPRKLDKTTVILYYVSGNKPAQMLNHRLSLAHLHNLYHKFPLPEWNLCAHSFISKLIK